MVDLGAIILNAFYIIVLCGLFTVVVYLLKLCTENFIRNRRRGTLHVEPKEHEHEIEEFSTPFVHFGSEERKVTDTDTYTYTYEKDTDPKELIISPPLSIEIWALEHLST